MPKSGDCSAMRAGSGNVAPSKTASPKQSAVNTTPAASSTSGYRAEMRVRQKRQRPRNSNQPMTGKLSRARIGTRQRGQRERGFTMLKPAGTR